MNNKYNATKEKWDELFQVSKKIYDLKMWEKFIDTDFFKLHKKTQNSYSIVSIMGNSNQTYGISLGIGNKGALGFYFMLNDSDQRSPNDVFFRQESINLYFEDKESFEEINEQSKENLEYIVYDDIYIYFKRFKQFHYPYNIEKDDVDYAIDYLNLLIEAYNFYLENNIKVDFDNHEIFTYYYDKFNKKYRWKIEEQEMYVNLPSTFSLFDYQKDELYKLKKTKDIYEVNIEILELGTYPGRHKNHAVSRAISIIDHRNGEILDFEVIKHNDNENTILLDMLIDIFKRKGIPKELLVGNRLVAMYSIYAFDFLNINIEISDLECTDNLLEHILNDLMSDEYTINEVQ